MTVKTKDGGTIQIKDFLHNGVTIPDIVNPGHWVLAGSLGYKPGPGLKGMKSTAYPSKLFQITYDEQDQFFNTILISKPVGKARQEAEKFLLRTLRVTKEQLCRLNYNVGTTYRVDDRYDYGNLGISFCPDARELPLK